jgi:hypothetical protein
LNKLTSQFVTEQQIVERNQYDPVGQANGRLASWWNFPMADRFWCIATRGTAPMAKMENIATAAVDPINARGEPCRFNHPKCAAQATTAGGSNERKPATIPIPIAKTKT